ncbi:MAG: outer membrane beta-barrel protein [Parvularculaceae bacterium]|nr:outer membrane beta-barrel protein [Parvularculaceae bacterium]
MNLKLAFGAGAACAALMMGAAASADDGGFYVGAFAGLHFPEDVQLNGFNAANQVRAIEARLDNGTVYGAAVGYAGRDHSFGRWRAEVETSFRSADLDGLALNGVDRTVLDGSEVSTVAALVNVAYDTPKFFDRLRFSAGAGFGLAVIDHEIRYLVANAAAIGSIPGNLQIAIPSSEATYAYQLLGGADFALTNRLSLTTEFRYVKQGDVDAERFILNSIINGVATTNGTLDSILESKHDFKALTFGLRYRF